MNRFSVVVALFLLFLNQISAQITLRGKVANYPEAASHQLALEYWSVDHWQQLDAIKLDQNSSFSVKIEPLAAGQCRLRAWNQNRVWADFILPDSSQADRDLRFDLDFDEMNGGPARIAGSAENKWYFQLMTAYRALVLLRDSSTTATPNEIKLAESQFNQLCNEMAQHKGSFTGDIVAPLFYEIQTSDFTKDQSLTANAFAIAHALEKVPFRYSRVLNHNGFPKALNRYYNYFDHKTGGKQFIDGVMSRRNGNDEVDAFVFQYLLNKMINFKDEEGLTYLLDWYKPDCSEENPLPNSTKTLVEALKNCAPGKQVADISLPDLNGNQIKLSEVCAKQKLTLLLFWRSTCSHCKEFEPILATIYEKYHPLGVEIYALSMDREASDWKTFSQQNPVKWISTLIPEEKRAEISQQFAAPSTPTLIGLDRDRKVVNRLIIRSQLESYLDETLPKLK